MADMRILLSVFLLASSVLCDDKHHIELPKLGRRYELMYDAETWQDAKQTCSDKGAKLAVPKSQEEFNAIQAIVRKMHLPSIRGCTGNKLLAWLGVSSVDSPVWTNVDGQDIETTGFSTWVKGNGDRNSNPAEPHCAVLDAVNIGLRSYWCHLKQPFVCQFNLRSSLMQQK